MSDVIKKIQSRLKRAGIVVSREDIRNQIEAKQTEDETIIFDSFASMPAIRSSEELSIQDKQELVIDTATKLNVELPVEAISSIANSIDWAISSRVEMMRELRGAVNEWAKHKLSEAHQLSSALEQETNQLFNQVSRTVQLAVNQDNERITKMSNELTHEVEQTVENFQKSSAELLKRFAIPGKP